MAETDHVLDRLAVQLGELLELQRRVYDRQAESIRRIEQIQADLETRRTKETAQ